MHAESGLQNKPSLSRWLLAGVMVAVLAFGWRIFRVEKTPAHPVRQTVQVHRESIKPGASIVLENRYLETRYVDVLNQLRKKLSGSGEDVLATLAEIAQIRPDFAIDLAQDLGRTDEEKAAWTKDIVKKWAEHNPKQAWDWLTQQTYRGDQQVANLSLVGVVLDATAASNPEMLIENVDTLLHQNNTSGLLAASNTVYLGLQALARSGNVELAQAAVEAWANDPLKLKIGASAYETVALAMDKNAPENTGTWLRSLPASEDRNFAINTFAFSWGERDPTSAIRWVETLTPQDGQSDIVSRIFSEWMRSDAKTAASWLDDYVSRTSAIVGADLIIGSLVLFSPARNPSAAIDYLQKSPTIAPEQKQLLMQEIQGTP